MVLDHLAMITADIFLFAFVAFEPVFCDGGLFLIPLVSLGKGCGISNGILLLLRGFAAPTTRRIL